MSTNLFLANWADLDATESQCYIDYETLINSDDEYLCLSSMIDCDFDCQIDDELFYDL